MKLEFAQSVVDFMYDSGTDAKLYEDYSGRWMYGSTTAAVVGDLSEVLMAIG